MEAEMDLATAPAENSEDNARQMLRDLCDNGFDGSINATALALGRDAGELRAMLDNGSTIDEDLVVKIRGIAEERGIEIGAS
jgi:hypothetical protein